jgi:hypothetical protein
VPFWKFSKKICASRPTGDLPPIQRAGGPKIFPTPLLRVSSRIRNFFIREEDPKASRPPNGREVPILSYFLFKFIFYKLFKIYTFFKYKIYSPYSFVYI